MSKDMEKTQPVILIGAEPQRVSEIRRLEIIKINSAGLEYSINQDHGQKVTLQIINDTLKIVLHKEEDL